MPKKKKPNKQGIKGLISPEQIQNAIIINGVVYKLVDDPVDIPEYLPCYGCALHTDCASAIGVICVNVFSALSSGKHFEIL